MAPPARWTDPELQRVVRYRHALCLRYRRNADKYRQARIAEALGIPQSAVSKFAKGQYTAQIPEAKKPWVMEMVRKSRYWRAKQKPHTYRAICAELRIAHATYFKIVRGRPAPTRQSERQSERQPTSLIHQFLTRRAA